LAPSPLRFTPINFFKLNPCGHSPCVTPSVTRGWVCRLQSLLIFASAVILGPGSGSRGTHDNILLSQIRDSYNLEGQVPIFISRRNRVAQLYPQVLDSLFVASYDSQVYDGGIRTASTRAFSSPLLCLQQLLHDWRFTHAKSKSKSHCDWWSANQ
jgi:hypothetical protein